MIRKLVKHTEQWFCLVKEICKTILISFMTHSPNSTRVHKHRSKIRRTDNNTFVYDALAGKTHIVQFLLEIAEQFKPICNAKSIHNNHICLNFCAENKTLSISPLKLKSKP